MSVLSTELLSARQVGEIYKKSTKTVEEFVKLIAHEINQHAENYHTANVIHFPSYLNISDRVSIIKTLQGKGYVVHRDASLNGISIHWEHTSFE